MSRPKRDALIAAMIAKLPDGDEVASQLLQSMQVAEVEL
jgi:hypothetical protein